MLHPTQRLALTFSSRRMASLAALASVLALSACNDPRETAQLPAYVEADMTQVASPVAGILAQMGVKEGQSVKAGDALYVLESNREQAQLAEAEPIPCNRTWLTRSAEPACRYAIGPNSVSIRCTGLTDACVFTGALALDLGQR